METSVFPRAKAAAILAGLISDDQLLVYGPVLAAAKKAGLRVAVGGGLAFSAYSGCARNTKDMDLFVVDDEEKLMAIMADRALPEYTDVPYDRTWSYRGTRGGYIVDLLWRMLNGRGAVDDVWTSQGWELEVRGVLFRLVPPEELLWSKLYILRRDRSDWPDILNIVFAQGPGMDWEHLCTRLEEDVTVLAAVMTLFRWMCPGRAANFRNGYGRGSV